MVKKNSLTLDKEFLLYCEINNIKDIDKLAIETFNRGFSLLKYGETPNGNLIVNEKIIEKEVIVEVEVEKIVEIVKEVPVEVIIEKEIIKEVPIEVKGDVTVITKEIPVEKIIEVIKEVQVEKIIEVVDNKKIEELTEENLKLKQELENFTKALDKLNKGSFMKNSDLNSLYDE